MKKTIVALSIGLLSSAAFAQTGVQCGTPFGSGQDSIRCRQNLSLLSTYAQSGDFKDAYKPWKQAFDECPGSLINIYIYGEKILAWKYSQETDATKKQAIIDELMKMYDMRLKYFGNNPKYGPDFIVGMKASQYVTLSGNKADFQKVYDWLLPIVQKYKEQTRPRALYYFCDASYRLALQDKSKVSRYMKDFMEADNYLTQQITAAGSDSVAVARIDAFKIPMEAEFGRSGFANADVLQKVYTKQAVEEHKNDKNYLNFMVALFNATNCQAPVYYQASKYLFNLEPSAGAAMGLAGAAITEKKYDEATTWLKKAIELSKKTDEKAKCYELLAQVAQIQNKYGEARQYCNQALSLNPHSGKSYIMIAQLIATAGPKLFSDPVKQRCVYFLVLDKLAKAAAVDPSSAAKANSLAAQYRKYLPSASEIFMHPDLEKGKSFFIGGWINESTIIR